MTRALDGATETLRDLPEDEQDAAARAIFAYISNDNTPPLDTDTTTTASSTQ
jgi:hypothetical protein